MWFDANISNRNQLKDSNGVFVLLVLQKFFFQRLHKRFLSYMFAFKEYIKKILISAAKLLGTT